MRLKMVECIISMTLAEVFGQYAYILGILHIIHHIWAQRATWKILLRACLSGQHSWLARCYPRIEEGQASTHVAA